MVVWRPDGTIQFAQEYLSAFLALPAPYQADDCLMYVINSTGTSIIAQPKPDQEAILGSWIAVFDDVKKCWYDISTGNPIN
jgi:hypothetical protein